MRNTKIYKVICFNIIIALIMTSIFIYNAEAATALSEKIVYTDALKGADGKIYKISGKTKSLIYNKDGSISYIDFNTDYDIGQFKINDKYGFCVEWGRDFENNQTYSSISHENNNYLNRLPARVREGIKLASLYGWQLGKKVPIPGCNSSDWYIATQLIIWEYQQGIRTGPDKLISRAGMSSNTFKDFIKNRPAEKLYNKILEDIKKHKIIPSFSDYKKDNAKIHLMKYNEKAGEYSITIKDLSNYDKTLKLIEGSGVSYEKKDKTYKFYSMKPLEEKALLTFKNKTDSKNNLLIWMSNDEDQRISTGSIDELIFYSKFRTEENGLCKIVKTSEDNIIENITFEISSETMETKSVTTNEKGEISIELQPNTYTVTEIQKDIYLQQEPQIVNIEEGQTQELSFHNALKKGQVEIKKKDANTYKVLKGCNIEILNDEKERIDFGITGDDGLITFGELPIGEYYFKETKAPKGFEIDETLHKFKISEEGETVKKEITNEKIKKVNQPKTGDSSELLYIIILVGVGFTVGGYTLMRHKK